MTATGETALPSGPPPSRRMLLLWVGLVLVGLHLAVGGLTLVWTPYDPAAMGGGRLEPPSLEHWAGTDRLGRDFFTRIMIGSRIALFVGSGAVAIGAAIGVTLGILAAFATRLADDALAAALDILIAFPTLLIAMLVVAASDSPSLWTAILALGLAFRRSSRDSPASSPSGYWRWTSSSPHERPAPRGPASFSSMSFPTSGRRCRSSLALQFGLAVIAEASLSISASARRHPMHRGANCFRKRRARFTAPIGAIAPGIALLSLVIGINLVTDGLRDVGDPIRRTR